ncbi:uncharacterized protein LOC110265115 [Arachis ipaensis]|uniref:uncharacterized protein LOC110265115 n=1 Tax=Arachis ipaensis TaxID=130454 RepID=UPI000A2B2032|nr:uncharacterized protein LOC110265115 [Arachis ipaensis]
MSEYFAVPVFHHEGKFVRDSGGYMSYVDGKVKRFPPMDLDYVNFFDLVVLFKELGYVEYKEMYWYDILASDMEAGLHPIKGDHEINEMRENKLKNRNIDECKDTWKWFLTLLAEDLGAVGQHGWNFISDQQKGLELAMKEVMPNAHHRNCVLHIWKNFIKHFKDQQTKQLVWECARQTTIQKFKASMEKLKNINQGAWEYLQRFDPAVWAKAYFSHGPKVDNITNNMCEVWNAKIVEYRGRPILTMIDDLRCYVMRKMALHKKKLENHTGKLAPVQHKRLEEFIKPKASKWRAIWAGDSDRVLFEVHRQGHKVGVNLAQRTCTCNVWQLTGMPCRHAVAAMYKIGVNPEDFVHTWLTMDSIRATYAHTMKPVNSEEYWEPTDAPRPLPPPIKRPAHRPKVKRRIDPVETEINPNKAKKTFEVTCNKCGQKGHYYKTCTNPAMDPNWKPMTKKERRANGAKKKSNSVRADVSKNTTNLQQEGGHGNCNEATNVAGVGVNHKEKAKKDKKKLPKGEKKTTAVAPEGLAITTPPRNANKLNPYLIHLLSPIFSL